MSTAEPLPPEDDLYPSSDGEPLPRPEEELDHMTAALAAATEERDAAAREQERLKALLEAAEARLAEARARLDRG